MPEKNLIPESYGIQDGCWSCKHSLKEFSWEIEEDCLFCCFYSERPSDPDFDHAFEGGELGEKYRQDAAAQQIWEDETMVSSIGICEKWEVRDA